ncbi:MAG: SPOR domain-containing protein [Bacteroidota bacterium]
MFHYNHITELITELMFRHDCVIVPDFGGFVARNYSSGFSKGSNILSPQTKYILFNKNLIHNDGLLISAWMQKSGSTITESTKQIEDYKDYIQSLLSAKKRFELNNLGLLYIDSENTLRFELKTDVNFLLDSFGFEPVVAHELIVEIEKPAAKPFEDRKITIEAVKTHKRSYSKILTFAIGIPVTLAFLLFAAYSKPMKPLLQSSFNPFYTPEKTYCPLKQNNSKAVFIHEIEKPSLLVDANGFATFKLCENGNVLVASINDSIAKTDKTNVVKPLYAKENNINSYDGKFQVVVGCFGVQENANKLIQELRLKNINAGISGVNKNGLHVVSCGGFNAKDEAAQWLTAIKSNVPNAWLMSK